MFYKLFTSLMLLWMAVLSQSAWADYEIRLPVGAKTQAEIEAEKYDPDELVLIFDTAITGGSAGIGLIAPVNITVDWGDKVANSTCQTVYTTTSTMFCDSFGRQGKKTVKVTGSIHGLGSSNANTEVDGIHALTRVVQFGNTGLVQLKGAFAYADNLTGVPKTLPSTTTYLNAAFSYATKFNDPNITYWNTSNVNTMYKMFHSCKAFNQDLDRWDTSNVESMGFMFNFATNFNGDLSTWDTSKVTVMYYMFWGVSNYTRNLDNWDVSNVTNFDSMFRGVQGLNGDWSNWNVTGSTSIGAMFRDTGTINLNIGNWDTSNIIKMSEAFSGTNVIDDLSSWNTSSATTMEKMFLGTDVRPKGIEYWDTSNVTNMNYMLKTNDVDLSGLDLTCWNVAKISAEPTQFGLTNTLPAENWPVWGTTGCY